MSEPKKRLLGRKRTVTEDPDPRPEVDDELTRLAAEALPEHRRKEWERSQHTGNGTKRSTAKEGSGEDAPQDSADDSVERDDMAEDLADEITRGARSTGPGTDETAAWYKIIMFGLILIGLLWLIVWYLLDYSWPIPSIGYGNVAVGIGLMMVGLVMTTRWR
ncbi:MULTISPECIES: cell division protein CrgA [Kocuria]|nr:cell division protein CrgA [Kocuria soli]